MNIRDVIERLAGIQRDRGGTFADALGGLDDDWFHVVLDFAQSAQADQDDGNAAIGELALAAIALDADTDDVELSPGRIAASFFAVLDAVEAERRRRSAPR